MRTLAVLLVLAASLAAQAEPPPTKPPIPPLAVTSQGLSLLERVNAPALQAPSPAIAGPEVRTEGSSVLESVTVQFQYFYFGPALGASIRL